MSGGDDLDDMMPPAHLRATGALKDKVREALAEALPDARIEQEGATTVFHVPASDRVVSCADNEPPADRQATDEAPATELPLAEPKDKPSRNRPGGMNVGRLKSFIKRIERLDAERTAIGQDIRDVYSELKGAGYDAATVRAIVRLRKLDAADRAERETLLDTYKHALGMT